MKGFGMRIKPKESFTCPICQEEKQKTAGMPGELINSPLVDHIQRKYTTLDNKQFTCLSCLEKTRAEYIQGSIEDQQQEVSSLQDRVNESLKQHKRRAKAVSAAFEGEPTLGQRAADKISQFAGSWLFVTLFLIITAFWVFWNTYGPVAKPIDPFPFAFFHLALSCLAAIQAPIIMMSQNRMEAQERRRSEYEYRVNLKAELEIRHLHAKIDQLLTSQWQRLLEIQQVQTELMEHIAQKTTEVQSAQS